MEETGTLRVILGPGDRIRSGPTVLSGCTHGQPQRHCERIARVPWHRFQLFHVEQGWLRSHAGRGVRGTSIAPKAASHGLKTAAPSRSNGSVESHVNGVPVVLWTTKAVNVAGVLSFKKVLAFIRLLKFIERNREVMACFP